MVAGSGLHLRVPGLVDVARPGNFAPGRKLTISRRFITTKASHHLQYHTLPHDFDRRVHQLPEIPGGGNEAKPEKDQGIRRPLPDVGDCSFARHRLQQIVEDCALRVGQQPLKEAALKLGLVTEEEFDRVVDSAKMIRPYIAKAS